MTPKQKIEQFVQDVYLTRYNRFLDSITDTDGVAEIAKTIRWTNMFLDELELETDNDGRPINWNFVRRNNVDFGSIGVANEAFTLTDAGEDTRRLVIDENRPLYITQDGSAVSAFDVVDADQITSRRDRTTYDSVTVLDRALIFSRLFKDTEIGGHLVGDVIDSIPRMVYSDPTYTLGPIDLVPYQLLVLGVAKNATLPDIVQGGTSPSYVQKYGDLLLMAKAENAASSTGDELVREDLSHIGGIS